jgi:hypothetical protein
MLSFGSYLDYSKHFFKVDGFDENGLPKILEVSFDGSKSKERMLSAFFDSKEQIKAVLPVLPGFDGLSSSSTKDVVMDFSLMESSANRLIYFGHHGKIQNLEYISEFTKLRYLHLDTWKKPLNLSKMGQLIEIIGTHVDFSGFEFSPLANIRHCRFNTCRNITNIPFNENTPLQYLHLMWDRDISSFEFIKEVNNLEIISLFSVSKLEHWPDSSKMTRLRRIYCTDTNRLFDYSGLAKAPNLECIHLGTKGLKPVHLEPFMQCKSLKYLGYFGTKKDMVLVREMFPGVLLAHDRPEDCLSLSVRFNEDDWVMR